MALRVQHNEQLEEQERRQALVILIQIDLLAGMVVTGMVVALMLLVVQEGHLLEGLCITQYIR